MLCPGSGVSDLETKTLPSAPPLTQALNVVRLTGGRTDERTDSIFGNFGRLAMGENCPLPAPERTLVLAFIAFPRSAPAATLLESVQKTPYKFPLCVRSSLSFSFSRIHYIKLAFSRLL